MTTDQCAENEKEPFYFFPGLSLVFWMSRAVTRSPQSHTQGCWTVSIEEIYQRETCIWKLYGSLLSASVAESRQGITVFCRRAWPFC